MQQSAMHSTRVPHTRLYVHKNTFVQHFEFGIQINPSICGIGKSALQILCTHVQIQPTKARGDTNHDGDMADMIAHGTSEQEGKCSARAVTQSYQPYECRYLHVAVFWFGWYGYSGHWGLFKC